MLHNAVRDDPVELLAGVIQGAAEQALVGLDAAGRVELWSSGAVHLYGYETPSSRELRLLQPEKLLHLLRTNYAPPEVTRMLSGKFAGPREALLERLRAWERVGGRKIILTGASSVQAYALMARERTDTFYCPDVAAIREHPGQDFTETERFADVTFWEPKNDCVYFDEST